MSVLFLSTSRYPNGGADAVRLENMVKLIKKVDEDVFVVSRGTTTEFRQCKTDDIPYISFRHKDNSIGRKVIDYLLYSEYLKKYVLPLKSWDYIFVHSVPTYTLRFIKRYAKKRGIQLIYDCVEWYSKEEFKLGRLSPSYIIKDRWIRVYINDQFKVIAISRYLQEYFQSKGIDTIRIPVTMDMASIKMLEHSPAEKIIFMYAGSPGGKDALNVMLEGFRGLKDKEKALIEFWIVGVTWEWIKKKYKYSDEKISEMKSYIIVFGRVQRENVLEKYCMANYTVLLRPEDMRYAKAGFPTKVVESLAYGVPVITNMTSDLKEYICDGENGYIVDSCEAEALTWKIRSILELSDAEMRIQRKKARETAEKNFDYCGYVTGIEDFLR